jgi:hypothetical protein
MFVNAFLLFVYLFVHLYVCPDPHSSLVSVRLSVFLLDFPSLSLSLRWSCNTSVCLLICPFIHSSVCCLSFLLSICLPVLISVHLPEYLSFCPFVCLSFSSSVRLFSTSVRLFSTSVRLFFATSVYLSV